MKLSYVTTFDARDFNVTNNWAGTGYYIPESLKNQSLSIHYIGSLNERLASKVFCKLKRHYHELFSEGTYFKALDPLILQHYAHQVSQELSKVETDIVFSATITPIAYLECQQPIVFWADATFENMLNFYPQYTELCKESIRHGHLMERLALQKCKLAIYSSDWAAQTAINYYQTDPSKVKVVPFGANIENHMTFDEIKNIVESRPSNKCKLLFIGYDWLRKSGNIAVELTKILNNAGLDTELTVIGCTPQLEESVSQYVKTLGIISKSTAEGKAMINQLLLESHFLIMPSKAECYGIVFCEANSFGLPCLATKVGGIPTIIKDDLNGKLFDKNSDPIEYSEYILNLFENYTKYKNLALSTFHEYESRLNWGIAGQKVKELLMSLV